MLYGATHPSQKEAHDSFLWFSLCFTPHFRHGTCRKGAAASGHHSAGPLGAQRQRIALGWRHFPEWGWWVDVAELHGIVIDGYTSAVLRTELSSPHTSSVCPCKRVQNLYTSTEHMDVRWLAKITLFADKPLGFVCCTACSCPCGTNINMTGDRSKMALAQV